MIMKLIIGLGIVLAILLCIIWVFVFVGAILLSAVSMVADQMYSGHMDE